MAAVGATVRGLQSPAMAIPSDEYTDNPYDYETERATGSAPSLPTSSPIPELSTHLIVWEPGIATTTPFPRTPAFSDLGHARARPPRRRRLAGHAWRMTGDSTRLLAGANAAEDETTSSTTATATSISARPFSPSMPRTNGRSPWTDDLHPDRRHCATTTSTPSAPLSTTGRLTAAWLLANRSVEFRGSYGTGFNQPSLLELYGRADVGYAGNPALAPGALPRGWDAGVDYYVSRKPGALLERDLVPERFREPDRIQFRRLSRHDGERGAGPNPRPRTRAPVRARRPRPGESGPHPPRGRGSDGDGRRRFCSAAPITPPASTSGPTWAAGFSLGAGGTWVGVRADVDAQTFATVNDPGYDVARIYAAWQANRHLSLKVRVENALDRRYEPVNGYPGAPHAGSSACERSGPSEMLRRSG